MNNKILPFALLATIAIPKLATAEGTETIIHLPQPAMVKTVPVTASTPQHVVSAIGRVISDPAAVVDVNASISGRVEELFIMPGSRVSKGDIVATVTSPDFIYTQYSYLALLENDEQQYILEGEGNLPSFMADARDNLHWWGMSDAQIDALEQTGEPIPVLSVTVPDDGVITEVLMRRGEIIDAGDRTMQTFVVLGRPVARMIRDDGRRYMEVLMYQHDLPGAEGLPKLRLPATDEQQPDELLELTVMPREVDPVTLQTRALADLGSAGNSFDIGQVMEVELVRDVPSGLWVPKTTVLSPDIAPTVFVKRKADSFDRLSITIMGRTDGKYLIDSDALQVGDQLVARGKTMLEGAYRRSRGGHDNDSLGHHH